MGSALKALLGALADALVPFVSAYAGYKAGQYDERIKNIEDENQALRKELERVNNGPLSDDDINELLEKWKRDAG